MAKYLLIAAIVISLVTAGIGFVNHQTLVDTKATLEETKTKLSSTTTSLNTRTKELADTKNLLELANGEKAKLAADLQSTQTELGTAKASLDEATKAGAEKDAKITDLETQLAAVPKNPEGENGPGAVQAMIDKYNKEIADLQSSLTAANDNLKATQAKVSTLEKAEQDRQQGLVKLGLEGRVLAVNPAWNFVVLSIGDKQGVVNNAELLLKRGSQLLGKVRVTSVEPSTSIADIVANSLPSGVAVQPGDTVIYQGN